MTLVVGWRTVQGQRVFGGWLFVSKSCYIVGKVLPTGEGN